MKFGTGNMKIVLSLNEDETVMDEVEIEWDSSGIFIDLDNKTAIEIVPLADGGVHAYLKQTGQPSKGIIKVQPNLPTAELDILEVEVLRLERELAGANNFEHIAKIPYDAWAIKKNIDVLASDIKRTERCTDLLSRIYDIMDEALKGKE